MGCGYEGVSGLSGYTNVRYTVYRETLASCGWALCPMTALCYAIAVPECQYITTYLPVHTVTIMYSTCANTLETVKLYVTAGQL